MKPYHIAATVFVIAIVGGCGDESPKPDVAHPQSPSATNPDSKDTAQAEGVIPSDSTTSAARVGETNSLLQFDPARLYVVSRTYKTQLPSEQDDNSYPFGRTPSTKLGILMTTSKGFITEVWTDYNDARINSFIDDTGFDLLPGLEEGDISAVIAADFKAVMLTLATPTSPQPKATTIRVRGKLLVSTASTISRARSPVLQLKKSETADVAGFTFTVDEAQEYSCGGFGVSFTRIATELQRRNVARIYFEDADGNRIAARHGSFGWSGTDEKLELTDSFDFEETPSAAIIVVESWVDRQEETVAYDVSSTMGGGR